MTCGIPQSLILGPLLFILYVNDLRNANPDNDTYLYADRMVVVVSSNNFNDIEVKTRNVFKKETGQRIIGGEDYSKEREMIYTFE